jgi:tRNA(Ile)-lysidine synthase
MVLSQQQGTILVGSSGGLDSTALTHLLVEQGFGPRLKLVHVHHGLRGSDADADQSFVEALGRSLGVDVVSRSVATLDVAKRTGKGIEAAARHLRYEVMNDIAVAERAAAVCTAHTADDQAETVLLRISRGTGIEGLASIQASRLLPSGAVLLRPLLDVRRTDILDLAAVHGWSWREDSSNVDQYFTRNRIRHTVLPFLKETFGDSIIGQLCGLASSGAQAAEIINDVCAPCLERMSPSEAPLSVLESCSPAVRTAVLRRWIRLTLGEMPSAIVTARLTALLTAAPGSKVTLNASLNVIRERRSLVLSAATIDILSDSLVIQDDGVYVLGHHHLAIATKPASLVSDFGTGKDTIVIDKRAISGQLVWRVWHHGESFKPFGAHGRKLVSDTLTDAKVPTVSRDEYRILADDQGPVWICGLRLADRVKVTPATDDVYVINVWSNEQQQSGIL